MSGPPPFRYCGECGQLLEGPREGLEGDLDKAKAALREIANPDAIVADSDTQVLDVCVDTARAVLRQLGE